MNTRLTASRAESKSQQTTTPRPNPTLSDDQIKVLRSRALNETTTIKLPKGQMAPLKTFAWQPYAPPDVIRRMLNINRRLQDFPTTENLQPTRLGNVLRHYEEETDAETVESLVEEVFDRLPLSLQIAHDEQRGQLDLYCSMVFVWLLMAVVAILRFGWQTERSYCLASALIGLVSAWFTYRAAVASARYYGALLLQVAAWRNETDAQESRPRWWDFLGRYRRG